MGPEELLGPSRALVAEQLDAALAHALTRCEPFLRSYQMADPGTLNHFFRRKDYQRLSGNPLFGYYHVGGFTWPPGVRAVAFQPPGAACLGARAIPAQAWERAMALVARARSLELRGDALIQIRGAVVQVQAQERVGGGAPGYSVVVEYRVQGPGGTLLYRLGSAKATLADAIGANLDFLLGFARGLGDGRERPPLPAGEP